MRREIGNCIANEWLSLLQITGILMIMVIATGIPIHYSGLQASADFTEYLL